MPDDVTRPWTAFIEPVRLPALQRAEFTRTAERFESLSEIDQVWQEANAWAVDIPRGAWSALFDVRQARGRNDEAFEALMNHHVTQFFARFACIAIVVQTTVGGMQVGRMMGATGLTMPARIFDDPDTARRWLMDPHD